MKPRFFEIAKKLSRKSTYWHKLGAVIVYKNRLIGLGFNNPSKTHTRSNNFYKTIHAELSAIINAGQDSLEGCEIYVYREHADGSPALSKPCKCCRQIIESVGIKKIHYTTNNGFHTEKVS